MMGDPTGYQITSYGNLIKCEPRTPAYAKALCQVITPGCRVIDIGAGPGIFSLLACQYGAGSVIAIEPHDSVELLRASAITNGFADRITIFKGLSTDYSGPAADVIVSDLRSCLPLFEHHIPSIIDARERLLAAGGCLIPGRDRLFAALVRGSELYRAAVEPWIRNAFGLDLSDVRPFVVNQWRKAYCVPEDLLSAPHELLVLDYATVTDPNISVDFVLTPKIPGEAHGFLVWFDAELAAGIGFSNAPGAPEQVYGQVFFPFEVPVPVSRDVVIAIKLRADLIGSDYVWSWTTKVSRGEQATFLEFSQSTLRGRVLSSEKLARASSSFVPLPSIASQIDRHCLSLFNGVRSLGDIAAELVSAFPDQFSCFAEALARVIDLSERYRGHGVSASPRYDDDE